MTSRILRGLSVAILLATQFACDDDEASGRSISAAASAPVPVVLGYQTVDENSTVTLNGEASHDPDGDLKGFAWTQIAGPAVTLTNANGAVATFTAPNVGEVTVLRFTLTVTDATDKTSSADTEVAVVDLNAAPTVNVPSHLLGNALANIELTGTAIDPDSTDVPVVAWTQISGPDATLTNANELTASATLPDVNQPLEVVFALTATDSEGKSASQEVAVNVEPVAASIRISRVPSQPMMRNTPWTNVAVEIRNATGDRITGGDASAYAVTLNKKAGTGGDVGNLVGTLTVDAVAGVATFSNVMYDQVTPLDADLMIQASIATPALGPVDATAAVKITWPTLLPGIVNAQEINVRAAAMVADGTAQDVLLAGDFRGTDVQFSLDGSADTATVSSTGQKDGFVARYNGADGTLEWVYTLTGSQDSSVAAIGVATTGQIFLGVEFRAETTFPVTDADDLVPAVLDAASTDIAIASVTAAGSTTWVKSLGGSADETVAGLGIDSAAGVVVAGSFGSTVDFNPDGTAVQEHTAVGSADAFAVRLTVNGEYVYSYATGLEGTDSATAFFVQRSNNLAYLAGDSVNGAFFIAIPGTGTPTWSAPKYLAGDGEAHILGLGATNSNLYVMGDYMDAIDFDASQDATYPMESLSGTAGFMAVYSATGTFQLAASVGNATGNLWVERAMFRDGSTDSAILVGGFDGPVDFDPLLGSEIRDSQADGSAFVLSLTAGAEFEWVGVVEGGLNTSANALVAATTNNRVLVAGSAINNTGDDTNLDVDPRTTEVLVPMGTTGNNAFVTKMNEKGLVVP